MTGSYNLNPESKTEKNINKAQNLESRMDIKDEVLWLLRY